jgi:hypothetical protein
MVFPAGGSIPKSVWNDRCTVVTEFVFADCCGITVLQHGLFWQWQCEILSRIDYNQTSGVFVTIVYCMIVGLLVTLL